MTPRRTRSVLSGILPSSTKPIGLFEAEGEYRA